MFLEGHLQLESSMTTTEWWYMKIAKEGLAYQGRVMAVKTLFLSYFKTQLV